MAQKALLVTVALVATACGDSGASARGAEGEQTTADTTLVFELKDSGRGFGEPDAGPVDVPGDLEADSHDASMDGKCLDPGAWGCPCTENAACNSGYCVDTADGRQCSKLCVEDCPGDWLCVGVTGTSGDLTFVCAPPYVTLCRPCEKDGDCQQLGAEIGVHRCLPLLTGDGQLRGSFCGYDCSKNQPCPTGYSCAKTVIEGSTVAQCRPDSGTCSCSSQAIAGGFKTACNAKNQHGTCAGVRKCTDNGLTGCDAQVPAAEQCNSMDDDCDGTTDEGFLYNDFGVSKPVGKPCGVGACVGGEVVCAPGGLEAVCSTGGGAVEKCDGADNDCDGKTDEANELDEKEAKCSVVGACGAGGAKALCVKGGWQCDYSAVKLYEGATELSCDGIDNDCDGSTDEDFTVSAGGKKLPVGAPCGGVGLCKKGVVECKEGVAATAVCSTGPGGSNDGSKAERCNDLDDDCDGQVDEGCDDDGDGFCDVTMKIEGKPKVCGNGGGDCNDESKFINPAATEVCDDVDNDCKDGVDDGCDMDADGYCAQSKTIVGNPKVCSKLGFDCDDKNKAIHPGVAEVCDGVDNDCNGQVDAVDLKLKESAPTCENQSGVCKGARKPPGLCKNGKWVACDDAAYFQHHGAFESGASETSCDNADNDCDGKVDEGCDDDGDGRCDIKMDAKGNPKACPQGGGDCDDNDKTVHPGAVETCNGKDDDCDKLVDAADAKLGNAAPACESQKGVCKGAVKPVKLCKNGQWKTCADAVYLAHSGKFSPGVLELSCDDLDNNCNGKTDESCDADGDGYCGELKKVTGTPKACPAGGGDCDDKKKAVNPGATEVCDAAFVDENCNGKVGEPGATGCTNFYYDGDSDGYGAKGASPVCMCQPDANKKLTALKPDDCNDGNFNINPGAVERCDSGGDDNCNGKAQEQNAAGCKTYWYDPDNDGFGSVKHPPKCLCYPDAITKYTATKSGDCSDGSGSIGPDKKETCATPYDDNCDGSSNDINAVGCTKYYKDEDKDGYGAAGGSAVCMCAPLVASNFTATKTGDCNDGDKAIRPGVSDTCVTKNIDDNCDGKVDPENATGCKKYYFDSDGDGFGVGAPRCFCGPMPALKFTALANGDCDDKLKSRYPNAPELCNGVDDDCDKTADEGASAACPKVANGTATCVAGKCTVSGCAFGRFDVDGQVSNGCECSADSYYIKKQGKTCSAAVTVAEVPDNGTTRYVGGNIMPGESGDWFKVYARDNGDTGASHCDAFNFRAWLSSNPGGQFVVDMYRGSCAASGLHCAGQTSVGWTTRFYGSPYGPRTKTGTKRGLHKPSPTPLRAGECKCTTSNANGKSGPGLPGMNMCSNNSAWFYIRVYRKAGVKPTCQNYTLGLKNG